MKPYLFVVLLAFSSLSFATDCNTDCRKSCTDTQFGVEYMDWACKWRCETERAVSCRTNLTSCDAWRVSQLAPYFYAGEQAVKYSSEQGWIKDANDCHRLVDRAATGAGIAGGINGLWTNGLSAAKWLKDFSVAGWAVSEGAKHFSHCVCTKSSYAEVGATHAGTPAAPANDMYFISYSRRDGKWAESWGPASQKSALITKTRNAVGGAWYKWSGGFFHSQGPTTASALCTEENYVLSGNGSQPLHQLYQTAVSKHRTHCLFRVANGTNIADVFDRVYVSLSRNDGRWAAYWGPRSHENQLMAKALQGVGGHFDQKTSNYFSSSRITQVDAHCTNNSFTFTGHDGTPLDSAGAEAKQKGFARCNFSVRDISF